MNSKWLKRYTLGVFLLILLAFTLPAVADEDEPSVGNLFIKAYQEKNESAMKELIKTRTQEFPPEVKAMIEYAMSPGVSAGEQDFLFNIAGTISSMFGEQTGDKRLLNAVKMNYQRVLQARQAGALPPESVEKAKKELSELGGGNWRVTYIKLNENNDLIIEIDVKESTGGAGFTPRISIKESQQAKEIIKRDLPKIKKGKISWSSMGVGLKTAFLE